LLTWSTAVRVTELGLLTRLVILVTVLALILNPSAGTPSLDLTVTALSP